MLLIYFKVVSRFPKQISFSIRSKLQPQTKKICPAASKLYRRSPRCGRVTSPVLEQDRRSRILVCIKIMLMTKSGYCPNVILEFRSLSYVTSLLWEWLVVGQWGALFKSIMKCSIAVWLKVDVNE